jgi:hypothetical protein
MAGAERLTPEAAQSVQLSGNPIRRVGQILRYAEAFPIRSVGLLPVCVTRAGLVALAESSASAEQWVIAAHEMPRELIGQVDPPEYMNRIDQGELHG